MAKINNFDEANDNLLRLKKNYAAAAEHSSIQRRLKCRKFALQLDCYEAVSC